MLCSLFWISWPSKMGPVGCPKTFVWNYQSVLRNVTEEHRSHMIWRCRHWFGSTWSGSEQSSLVHSGSALHIRIRRRHLILHSIKYDILNVVRRCGFATQDEWRLIEAEGLRHRITSQITLISSSAAICTSDLARMQYLKWLRKNACGNFAFWYCP